MAGSATPHAIHADASNDAYNSANRMGRRVYNMVKNTKDEICHVTDNVHNRIHEKPVQSSLYALAIGFALGALLRR